MRRRRRARLCRMVMSSECVYCYTQFADGLGGGGLRQDRPRPRGLDAADD